MNEKDVIIVDGKVVRGPRLDEVVAQDEAEDEE
jgi:hypothetical protein